MNRRRCSARPTKHSLLSRARRIPRRPKPHRQVAPSRSHCTHWPHRFSPARCFRKDGSQSTTNEPPFPSRPRKPRDATLFCPPTLLASLLPCPSSAAISPIGSPSSASLASLGLYSIFFSFFTPPLTALVFSSSTMPIS